MTELDTQMEIYRGKPTFCSSKIEIYVWVVFMAAAQVGGKKQHRSFAYKRFLYTCKLSVSQVREISVSILPKFGKFPTTSKHCRRCSDNFQRFQRCTSDFQRLPNVAVQSSKSLCDLLVCYLGVIPTLSAIHWTFLGGNWIQFFTLMVNKQLVCNCEAGVRNCLICMGSMNIFNPQACDSCIMHVNWQV